MTLRSRLLLSYVVVIVVTLVVITVALLLFLNARPAPSHITYQQIAAVVQGSLRELLLGVRPAQSTRAQLEILTNHLTDFSAENAIRTLVVNLGEQSLLFDSAGKFASGDKPDWQITPVVDSGIFRRGVEILLRNRVNTYTGGFSDPDGTSWLFVGLARQETNPTMLLFADQPPEQTLVAALSEYRVELGRPLLQAGFIGLLVAIVMSAIISRTIARPLQHIAAATAAVAKGNYDQEIPMTGPPEVRAVAESVNHMSAEVRSTQEAQRDFLINVSHDLKTPLTSIQGYSQAIMDGAAADPVQAASIIHEEAARLNRMVVEITDLARLQNGQFSMQMVAIDISQIVAAVGQRLAIVAQKKGLTLDVDATSMPEINGDGDRLAQVITNLVSNAIKYTPSGGKIRVKTQVNNGGIEIVVQDTGVGIPAEDLPRIFERFYQVDKARGPRRGSGLGLAITQEIVQAHGGTISATSAGAGKGSTFTVWLPSQHLNTVIRGKR
jgi:signal transduction histidine kinase